MTPQEHKDQLINNFSTEYVNKYNKGQEEHGGNLWEKPSMIRNAKDEVLDQWSYISVIESQIKEAIALMDDFKPEAAKEILRKLIS